MRALVVVLAAAGVWLGGATEPPRPAEAAFACGACKPCLGGHTNKHEDGQESEGIHKNCEPVDGCPHPDCVITFQTLPHADGIDRVLAEAEAGDLEAPGVLVRRFGGSVVFNEQRGALQLRSPCVAGEFIGHIPLTTAQIERLAAEN